MLRLADRWHLELGRKKRNGNFSWHRSGIHGYHVIEKGEEDDREWTIRELLDSDELFADGRAMRHGKPGVSLHAADTSSNNQLYAACSVPIARSMHFVAQFQASLVSLLSSC